MNRIPEVLTKTITSHFISMGFKNISPTLKGLDVQKAEEGEAAA